MKGCSQKLSQNVAKRGKNGFFLRLILIDTVKIIFCIRFAPPYHSVLFLFVHVKLILKNLFSHPPKNKFQFLQIVTFG